MIPQKKFNQFIPLTKDHFLNKMTSDRKLEDYYSFNKKDLLGQGSFGKVYKVQHNKSGLPRAMKVIQKSTIDQKLKVYNEVKIMKELDHPHIAKLFDHFEDDEYIYLIMELCSGGDIFDKVIEVGAFTEDQAQNLFIQLLRAIHYYNDFYIVHRDLKPENFLFQARDKLSALYMIDFGCASKNSRGIQLLNEKVGTVYYIAPEIIDGHYSHQSDLWSAGVILYILLCGYPPFCGNTEKDTIKLIQQGKLVFDEQEWGNISILCKDLINCLIKPIDQRITIDEIFQHVWIQSYLKKERNKIKNVIRDIFNIEKLEQWNSFKKLKQISLLYIGTQINTSEIEDIKNTFLFINEKQNGRISLQEMAYFLQINKDQLRKLFQLADSSQDNYIDFYGNSLLIMHQYQSLLQSVQIRIFIYRTHILTWHLSFQHWGSTSLLQVRALNRYYVNSQSDNDEVDWESLEKNTSSQIIQDCGNVDKIDLKMFKNVILT